MTTVQLYHDADAKRRFGTWKYFGFSLAKMELAYTAVVLVCEAILK